MTVPSDYSEISRLVDAIIDVRDGSNDPERRAYMVARSALLRIRALRPQRAAEVAYGLADELACEVGK